MIEITKDETKDLLRKYGYNISTIYALNKNDRVNDYVADNSLIIRLSEYPLHEIEKLRIVNHFSFVPKVLLTDTIKRQGVTLYIALMTFIKGTELYTSLSEVPKEDRINIATDIIAFSTQMHSVTSDYYDIGCYVPTIPHFTGSWKDGHSRYIEWLKKKVNQMELSQDCKKTISQAFDYIYRNMDSLTYEKGPVFLHNDLHPKNIIIDKGKVSGVIDFECAQYGERDFELVHLIHWSLFPPDELSHFNEIVQSIIQLFQKQSFVPNLDIRLTIYQLEHEINQMIWNPKKDIGPRLQRIEKWIQNIIQQEFFVD